MHELALTEQLLAAALTLCSEEQRPASTPLAISEIHLRVGSLTGVVPDSVSLYFDQLAAGTAAAGAQLSFEREEATATCTRCGATDAVELPLLPLCAHCGGPLEVHGGADLVLQRVVLVEESPS
jgi:hydrogenase nickel incorporation protein HypA/HybF